MLAILGFLLIFFEPLTFAVEALTVLPTIRYRGAVAAMELVLHAGIAALCAAAGLALWHRTMAARRLATIAVLAWLVRVVQSLYWTALPGNTVPGTELTLAAGACAIAMAALAVIRRSAPPSR